MVIMTATNSTSAIFWPGHERGPLDQGRNAIRGGGINEPSSDNHLVGRKESASEPHIPGLTCIQAAEIKIVVLPGTRNSPALVVIC